MKQPHIRVGVRGWDGATAADAEDASSTRNVLWVEVGGKRIDEGVIGVRGKYDYRAHSTMIEVIGVPEFVILGPEEVAAWDKETNGR